MKLKYDKISEAYEQMLKERFSDRIVHATFLKSARKILKNGEFKTSPLKKEGNSTKSQPHASNKRYISFARSLNSSYIKAFGSTPKVIFVFDGRILSQRYRGKSISSVDIHRSNSEEEDRLFTNLKRVPLNTMGLTEILLDSRFENIKNSEIQNNLRKIIQQCDKQKIKYRFAKI